MASETKSVSKTGDATRLARDEKRDSSRTAKLENAVTIIYVPLHLGCSHRGVSMGPAAMRVARLAERIEGFGFRVDGEVDIQIPPSVCWTDKPSTAKCVPEIAEVSLAVARLWKRLLRKVRFRLPSVATTA